MWMARVYVDMYGHQSVTAFSHPLNHTGYFSNISAQCTSVIVVTMRNKGGVNPVDVTTFFFLFSFFKQCKWSRSVFIHEVGNSEWYMGALRLLASQKPQGPIVNPMVWLISATTHRVYLTDYSEQLRSINLSPVQIHSRRLKRKITHTHTHTTTTTTTHPLNHMRHMPWQYELKTPKTKQLTKTTS